jgi:hypothetical protein
MVQAHVKCDMTSTQPSKEQVASSGPFQHGKTRNCLICMLNVHLLEDFRLGPGLPNAATTGALVEIEKRRDHD